MPPHCDSMDGPVVTAARRALDEGDVAIVLPYVPADAEAEVGAAFEQVLPTRRAGGSAGEIADRWFFETVVRLHRAGEGAPYTGLKPAGRDVGPVTPVAERAIRTGSADELVRVLTDVVAEQSKTRLDRVMALQAHEHGSVAAAREYVQAMLACRCGRTSCTWPPRAASTQLVARIHPLKCPSAAGPSALLGRLPEGDAPGSHITGR